MKLYRGRKSRAYVTAWNAPLLAMRTKAGEHGTHTRFTGCAADCRRFDSEEKSCCTTATAHSVCHRNTFPFKRAVKAFLFLSPYSPCIILFCISLFTNRVMYRIFLNLIWAIRNCSHRIARYMMYVMYTWNAVNLVTIFCQGLSVCRHFAMKPKLLRCTETLSLSLSLSLVVHFFAVRFVVLIIVITGGRLVRTRAFSPLAHPRASLLYMVSSTLGDRFRSSQLHFFLGRGKNKTMILAGIAPLPNCPGQHRPTSKTPGTIPQNS